MKVIGKYDNSFSANLVKGRLAEAGIESYILNENLNYTTATFNNDLLTIELVVDDSDYDRALEFLSE